MPRDHESTCSTFFDFLLIFEAHLPMPPFLLFLGRRHFRSSPRSRSAAGHSFLIMHSLLQLTLDSCLISLQWWSNAVIHLPTNIDAPACSVQHHSDLSRCSLAMFPFAASEPNTLVLDQLISFTFTRFLNAISARTTDREEEWGE